jgi:putative ABC transport system substrate-binding protein
MGGDTGGKLVEWLVAALPRLSRVGVLVTPTSPTYRAILESVQGAAQKAGIKTVVVEASNPQDIENAFATMASERVGAVVVGSSPLFAVQRKQIADLALKYRLPSMFGSRIDAEVGGFMAFGGVRGENYLRSATYVDKILKGAKPGDLPVEQPTQFELVVNLNTAKALGVTVPQAVLTRAEVIQ